MPLQKVGGKEIFPVNSIGKKKKVVIYGKITPFPSLCTGKMNFGTGTTLVWEEKWARWAEIGLAMTSDEPGPTASLPWWGTLGPWK